MTKTVMAKTALVLAAAMVLASCGNTIRGVGRDTASAINATQDAGNTVDRAARN